MTTSRKEQEWLVKLIQWTTEQLEVDGPLQPDGSVRRQEIETSASLLGLEPEQLKTYRTSDPFWPLRTPHGA